MDLLNLDPNIIQWPAIRVAAYYQEGQEELLKKSLAARGQQQPCVIVKVGDQYIGVDGKHRWQEAIERRDATVPCVVKEGTDLDVILDNLVLNSLRGRTKASEQVEVIAELERLGLSRNEIGKYTGHGRQWVEQHIRVSQASMPVRQWLDAELMTLGHADELAKVEDLTLQERLCHQLLQHRWPVKELRKRIQEAAGASKGRSVRAGNRSDGSERDNDGRHFPGQMQSTFCTFCHAVDPAKLAHVVVCGDCSAEMMAHAVAESEPQDDYLDIQEEQELQEEDRNAEPTHYGNPLSSI